MRDDICTIPVSEVFEINDGCPICRMRDTVEKRIVDYILGDAMMESDVRIETNRLGFCEFHFEKMMAQRGRLQLALMLQSHIDEIGNGIFEKRMFNSPSRKGEKAADISKSCFICNNIEFGFSRMLDTIYRCYENESDFREMFNSQPCFCLPHYERLISGANKTNMRSQYGEFIKNLNRITGDYTRDLHQKITKYTTMYDYRAGQSGENFDDCKDAVERTVAFLNGRHY